MLDHPPYIHGTAMLCDIITEPQLVTVSGNVHVDSTDKGCSEQFLVWMELGKNFEKRVIRRWRLREI